MVEEIALSLHERWSFDQVIALSEFDLLRAARLRRLFGVPGQDVPSATAFRDKLVMKRILADAGVPVVRFAPVTHFDDVLRFGADHGYPMVVKPRTGAGSEDVHVLHGEEDLPRLLAAHRELGSDDGARLLAETYVEHELIHVDGLVADGVTRLMWASTQGDSTCLDVKRGRLLHSCLLDADDPVLAEAVDLAGRALNALPAPETYLFHVELFRDVRGTLLVNEAASRMGGGMIEHMLQLSFGVSLPEVFVRFLAGGDPAPIPATPRRMAGLALFPPRAGILLDIPATCPVEGVVTYTRHAEPGQRLRAARQSVEKIASVLAAGPTRSDVEKSLAATSAWLDRSVVIDAGVPQEA
ncbi:hypothetical protein [Streptomyces sp. NPDC127066]|uniref:ATP-grasp domain-containing protein n=1 Tax=Streptomyces sp. NPDC127066 TaxID=3347125 RepID=UPI00365AF7D3